MMLAAANRVELWIFPDLPPAGQAEFAGHPSERLSEGRGGFSGPAKTEAGAVGQA
jgi:hypothetical protein